MTREEYDLALNALSTEYDKKRKDIIKEYAFTNNPHKIGDKVTDHVATLEIKSIHAYANSGGIPSCFYRGIQYNKDGKVSKKQDHTVVYQFNIGK